MLKTQNRNKQATFALKRKSCRRRLQENHQEVKWAVHEHITAFRFTNSLQQDWDP